MSTAKRRERRWRLFSTFPCFDRVILQVTFPGLCYAAGMTTSSHLQRIRIFDYAKFAELLRDRIRAHAEAVAKKHGLTIEFICKLKQFGVV